MEVGGRRPTWVGTECSKQGANPAATVVSHRPGDPHPQIRQLTGFRSGSGHSASTMKPTLTKRMDGGGRREDGRHDGQIAMHYIQTGLATWP